MGQRQDHLSGRYWPTRAQLVVVCGEPELVAQWFDAVREHHEAARDVIDVWDLWDEERPGPDSALGALLADAVGRMRYTLHQLRQWDVDS